MASSPPTPSHTPLVNPKKRPSLGLPSLTTQPDPKRQKIQPHPLRQSSYPDPAAPGFYSQIPQNARSETGSVANSLVSSSVASATKSKRPRGRPRKSRQFNEEDVEDSQTADNRGPRAAAGDGKSQVSARGAVDDEADDPDDDDDDDGEAVPVDEQERLRRLEENQRLNRLLDALTSDQTERYTAWRRTKINKVALRKIVNQTVSQSVTANPLQAIQIYSKNYIGEIIERSRDVQAEWAKARDVAVKLEKQARTDQREALETKLAELRKINAAQGTTTEDRTNAVDYRANAVEINNTQSQLHRLTTEWQRDPIVNEHRGALLPEHVREGLRRYKGDGEGGGVGFGSTSHHLVGVPGSGTWRVGQGLGGRRLFK
jgi:transcription initiation factor TFIID subunit 11